MESSALSLLTASTGIRESSRSLKTKILTGITLSRCCGTHLPSIHNLQLFLIPHTEALSRSSATSARLYFLCGPRLITHLTSTHSHLTNTSSILSCGPPLVPERVSQVVEERKRAEKRVTEAERELAEYIARDLVGQINRESGSGIFKRHIHRTDDTTNALAFLSLIAFALGAAISPEKKPHYVVVLSSSPSTQTTSSVSTVLVIGSDDLEVKSVGDGLKARLGVKGGGKGPRWSGKFSGIWKEIRENEAIDGVLEAL